MANTAKRWTKKEAEVQASRLPGAEAKFCRGRWIVVYFGKRLGSEKWVDDACNYLDEIERGREAKRNDPEFA